MRRERHKDIKPSLWRGTCSPCALLLWLVLAPQPPWTRGSGSEVAFLLKSCFFWKPCATVCCSPEQPNKSHQGTAAVFPRVLLLPRMGQGSGADGGACDVRQAQPALRPAPHTSTSPLKYYFCPEMCPVGTGGMRTAARQSSRVNATSCPWL